MGVEDWIHVEGTTEWRYCISPGTKGRLLTLVNQLTGEYVTSYRDPHHPDTIQLTHVQGSNGERRYRTCVYEDNTGPQDAWSTVLLLDEQIWEQCN